MPPPPAPALPGELLEEIFLRLPKDEPEFLVRASLASKFWLGLLSSPRFRRRYREFHGDPPMLGFFYSWTQYSCWDEEDTVPHFVPTTKFSARIPDDWGHSHRDYAPDDCRHGRLLLADKEPFAMAEALVVWDPLTGRRRELKAPLEFFSHGAAVLCAVTVCDHRTCHEGPFRVVFVGLDKTEDGCFARVRVSLPEMGEWTKPCSDPRLAYQWSEPCPALDLATEDAVIDPTPPVLIEDGLYFMFSDDLDNSVGVLKYSLSSDSLSLIDAPLVRPNIAGAAILMAMEDGSLGFAHGNRSTLYLWSRQMGFGGVASWIQCRVIDLNNLLPIENPEKSLAPIGSVEGRDIIFVTTDLGIYQINLKTLQWKKLWKREEFCSLIPYMSFYCPPERVKSCDVAH